MATLFVFSIYHYLIMNNEIPQTGIIYNEKGQAIGSPPYAPSKQSWFGTDRLGNDLFYKIISGAKYTIGIAVGISVIRIMLGMAMGYLFYTLTPFIKRLINSSTEPFRYIPATLFCYFILFPINISNALSVSQKTTIQMIVLILVALPTLSHVFKDEYTQISKKEFVSAARIFGGNHFHIFKKHMLPILKPRLAIQFVQQIIQTLLLLAHLGLLKIFIGGSDFAELFNGEPEYALSTTNEWSGLIGTYFYQLALSPWLLVIPVLFFALTILSMNLILEGLNQSQDNRLERPIDNKSNIDKRKILHKEAFKIIGRSN